MPTDGATYAQKLLMGLGWQNAGRANSCWPYVGSVLGGPAF